MSRSDQLSDYNIPFDGVTGSKLARARLRYLKTELRENPRVSKAYIRAGVREFIPGLKPAIDRIPQGSSLIIMPSTTGQNRIPLILGNAIRKLRPDVELVNAKGRAIEVLHDTPSKIKDRPVDRLSDHRSFQINPGLLARREQLNRSSLILDDSLSTGDSAITLHRQLLREGIYTQGIVAAVTGSKYHVRQSDIDRLYKTIVNHRPDNYSAEQLRQDMLNTFAGYPASKVKRLELNLSRDKGSQLYRHPDLLVHVVRTTSAYLNKEQLGANHFLELKQRAVPELRSQQRRQDPPPPGNKLKL